MKTETTSVAVFGATGSIGSALCKSLAASGRPVIAIGRSASTDDDLGSASWLDWSSPDAISQLQSMLSGASLGAVVWAQGANLNDDIHDFDLDKHDAMYAANVTFIMVSLQKLLRAGLLSAPAKLCVISSIWQNLARQRKLSYCVTKAALEGLVQSLCIDLGKDGHLINAVLPGALDTAMTRANLNDAQIAKLEDATPLGTLAKMEDVCGLVGFLCSADNTGITGQFIAADRGFSYARII
jgi:3-oxoacyl-[acyl-carrier protein] reductase